MSYQRDPLKMKARWRVQSQIRRGQIKRQPCEKCGKLAQAHHEDYSKPLEVRWLCSLHHAQLHTSLEDKTVKRARRGGLQAMPFLQKVFRWIVESDGCWAWKGEFSGGYPRLNHAHIINGRRVGISVPKFLWELFNRREIPAGMVIDYTCHHSACVNPGHFTLVPEPRSPTEGRDA